MSNALLQFAYVHIVKSRGSKYLPKSYSGSKRGGRCRKACERFSFYMAYGIDLKLCTMLYYYLQMCILSGCEDPIIFLKVIVDLRGVEGVKYL